MGDIMREKKIITLLDNVKPYIKCICPWEINSDKY
jgi:hypothetical protein